MIRRKNKSDRYPGCITCSQIKRTAHHKKPKHSAVFILFGNPVSIINPHIAAMKISRRVSSLYIRIIRITADDWPHTFICLGTNIIFVNPENMKVRHSKFFSIRREGTFHHLHAEISGVGLPTLGIIKLGIVSVNNICGSIFIRV